MFLSDQQKAMKPQSSDTKLLDLVINAVNEVSIIQKDFERDEE